jgi:hypothetical protein
MGQTFPRQGRRIQREFRQGPGNAFPGNGKQRWSEGRVAELERKVGQQVLEIDFLKGCSKHIEKQRMMRSRTWRIRWDTSRCSLAARLSGLFLILGANGNLGYAQDSAQLIDSIGCGGRI